jgi:hypothetical protein
MNRLPLCFSALLPVGNECSEQHTAALESFLYPSHRAYPAIRRACLDEGLGRIFESSSGHITEMEVFGDGEAQEDMGNCLVCSAHETLDGAGFRRGHPLGIQACVIVLIVLGMSDCHTIKPVWDCRPSSPWYRSEYSVGREKERKDGSDSRAFTHEVPRLPSLETPCDPVSFIFSTGSCGYIGCVHRKLHSGFSCAF